MKTVKIVYGHADDNRRGHYGRALEEALQTQKSQWPRAWNGVNPLAGSRTFNSMAPQERVRILPPLFYYFLT